MKRNKKHLNWNPFFKSYLQSIKKSSFILTASPQMKQFLIDYGIPDEKIDWLTFGVDLERFSKKIKTEKNKDYTLISTVQFLPNRGSDMILESMKKLLKNDPNIKFISMGNMHDQHEMWDFTLKKMKLDKNIILHGIVDNSEIPEFLSKSHIGISLLAKNDYYNKSPPQKIFEYMAMGIPTIANNLPTHTDYIKDGYNGFIVDSAEELVEAVLKLKNDKKLYNTMSKNALQSSKNYSLSKIEEQLKKHIEKFVKKNKVG
jgi:glycosyltransferase involved in cell wall biosynthesis